MSSIVFMEIFRDIKRRHFQVIAIVLTIGLGLSMLSIIGNMSASMHLTMNNIEAKYNEPNVVVWTENYLFSSDVIDVVSSIDGVELAEGKLSIIGSTILNDDFVRVHIYGTEAIPRLNTIIVSNESIWDSFQGNVCIVDEFMAEQVNISVGDVIDVFTFFGKLSFKVIALADAAWSISFSRPINLYIFVPLETVQRYYDSNSFSEIIVKVGDNYDVKYVYKEILNTLKDMGYNVDGWYEVDDTSFTRGIEIIFSVLFIPALLIAGLLLVTVLLNKVISEYRQFGIRKAIGFKPSEIFKMIVLYAVVIYILSIPVSLIFSWALTIALMDLMIKSWIPFVSYAIDFQSFFMSTIFGFIIIMLFALYPARKASKVNALDAIRWGFEVQKYKSKKSSRDLPLSLAIAVRNITRRKKRSALILISLILGSVAFMSISTITDSVTDTYQSVLANSKFDALISFSNFVNESVINMVSDINGVSKVEGYFYWYIDPDNTTFLVNNKIVNKKPQWVYPLIRFMKPSDKLYKPEMVKGSWIRGPGEIIISYSVSKYLNIRIGDTLGISYTSWYLNATLQLKVVGIAKMVWQNGWEFIADIRDAYSSGIIPNNTFTSISIKVSDGYKIEDVIEDVLTAVSSFKISYIYIPKYMKKSIEDITKTISSFMSTIVICTLAVLLIGITVSFLLAIIERRWEIGVLKAIGFTERDIFRIMLLESTIFASLSLLPAIILGFVFSNAFIEIINSSGFFIVIVPYISLISLILAILLPFIISIVSIVPSIIMSKRIKTVELLRKMF